MGPIVCYVTDRKSLGGPDPVAALAKRIQIAAAAGADWIQIRETDLLARILLEVARSAVAAVPPSVRVILNDRLDVAIAARAAGVHLGKESLPASETVRWCKSDNAPAGFLVGVSCHNLVEAQAAEIDGASYIIFGPVFETPSKRSFGPPQGTNRLREVCQSVKIPVIAIGGVTEENAPDCLQAGASGIAAIRLFQQETAVDVLAQKIAGIHSHRLNRSAEKS